MIMNMNEKGRQTKLLAAIAIIAMVVCVFAVVMPSDVSGADISSEYTSHEDVTATEVRTSEELADALASNATAIVLTADITNKSAVTYSITKNVTIYGDGHTITAGQFKLAPTTGTITVNIYDLIWDGTGIGNGYGISTTTGENKAFVDLTLDNCKIFNFTYKGIYVTNTVGFTLKDCIFEGNATATPEAVNTFGDYAVDLNLISVQNAVIEITGCKFIGDCGSYAALKITQRGTDNNTDDVNTDFDNATNATIESVKISGNDFTKVEGAKTPVDIQLGSGAGNSAAKTYTFGYDSTITAAGETIVKVNTVENTGKQLVMTLADKSVLTGTGSTTTVEEKTVGNIALSLAGSAAIEGSTTESVTLTGAAGGTITIAKDKMFCGAIGFGDNSVDFGTTGVKAGDNGITFKQGSVVISGNINGAATITAAGEVKLNGVDITGKLTVGTVNDDENKVIIQNLTIGTGGSLEIQTGATVEILEGGILKNNTTTPITNNGTLILNEPITSDDPTANADGLKVTNNKSATLAIAPGVDTQTTAGSEGTVVSTTAIGDSLGLNQNLDTDLTIKSSAFLEKNLTIQAGVTLTIGANATLDLNGCKLIVNGSIVIMNNGSIVNGGNITGAIVLSKSGSIENNGGVIGKGDAIDIKLTASESADARDQYNTGYITVQDVSGIGIVVDKKVDGQKVYYTLALTGDISKKGNVTGTVTVKNTADGDKVYVDGTLEVGNGTVLAIAQKATLELKKGATLDVASKGAINYPTSTAAAVGAIVLNEGATVNMDGTVTGNFQAPTGKYLTNGKDKATYTTEVTVTNVTGLTITATSVTAYDADEENTVTEVRLVLSGSVEQGSFTTVSSDKAIDA